MSELGTATRPLRAAIVGSGPSGFYAAEALFKSKTPVQVDLYDRLPTPYGLVRGGVAPDHQKIKNVTRVYDKTANNDSFAFLGNVMVGRDISVDELRGFYDVVIFTCGAETDRRLGIPGEDLPGSYTATEFVGWYNGHPDYRDRDFDLSGKVAVVIGQGNVAMDVSRILAKTVEELSSTDIAQFALDALGQSKIEDIYVIGRRGPAQAKFTPPEIKEIGELADCDPVVKPADMELSEVCLAELADPDNNHNRKNVDVLREFSQRGAPQKSKRYHLEFLLSPVELRGDGRVEELVLRKNRLAGEAGNQWAESTDETVTMPCDIFFRSVGYRGVAIPGVPFEDRKGIFPNRDGRIIDSDGDGDQVVPGLYAAGWIKRGPSGIIGTNKPDSVATVESVLADLSSLTPCATPDSDAVRALLAERGVRVVSFDDWKKIDAAEVAAGKAVGKPREKLATIDEMLAVLD
ncbi:NADP oxidoreductase [Haliangium sp.]|uniref:NADP oxidoreductase n=1 Tax=Haliangium sp. TaxID=2663208 RepID=UPI003D130E4F